MKHTPGPWIAVGTYVEHPNDKKADICTCDTALIGQGHLGRSYEEECANARLIAAAPELLEALQGMLVEKPIDEILVYAKTAKEKARAAIARATGTQE
jgi:hypothetical protein